LKTAGRRELCGFEWLADMRAGVAKIAPMLGAVRTLVVVGAFLLTGAGNSNAEVSFQDSQAERAPHPEPRVIVNVLSVRGPHDPARVQHAARFGWKRIVRCYKRNDPKRAVIVNLELDVSSEGSVTQARNARSNPRDPELATCLADVLPGLAMPKAPASSTADVEIRLAPGDPPANVKP
jgi:hypothetical protein